MITAYASGTLSTTGSGTEDFLSSPNVQGTFALQLDLNDMAAGDVIEVRAYKMAITGGTQRVVGFVGYYGAQEAHRLIAIPFDPIFNSLTDSNAVRFSIKQTFGTAGISIPWAVLKDDALTPTTSGRTVDVDASGGVEVGSFQNDAFTAAAMATDAVTEIVNAIIAIDVDGQDLQEALKIALAILAGKSSGLTDGYGTAVFRDIADTKTRATVVIDADGNRTAVTLDGT